MRWIAVFSGACLGLIALLLGLIWVLGGFSGLGVDGHGLAALILGVVATSVVGTGLMALVFFSNRSGSDERVHRGP